MEMREFVSADICITDILILMKEWPMWDANTVNAVILKNKWIPKFKQGLGQTAESVSCQDTDSGGGTRNSCQFRWLINNQL